MASKSVRPTADMRAATLTVEKADKVARRAGLSVADAEPVVLDRVRLSIEEPADATLVDGESVKLVGKVSVPRKNKKLECGATVGEPTFKKVVFQAPATEEEQAGQTP